MTALGLGAIVPGLGLLSAIGSFVMPVLAPLLRTELRAQAEQEADTYRDELAALRTGTRPRTAAPGTPPFVGHSIVRASAWTHS